jgi:hypothetical protein
MQRNLRGLLNLIDSLWRLSVLTINRKIDIFLAQVWLVQSLHESEFFSNVHWQYYSS